MTKANIYEQLATLWTQTVWGWVDSMPGRDVVARILARELTEDEARLLMSLPVKTIPLEIITLEEIERTTGLERGQFEPILDGIVSRQLLFTGTTSDGQKGYSLLSQGYGFSQVFYWPGVIDERARAAAELESDQRYTGDKRDMHTMTDTKVFRYIPVTEAIDPEWQHVYPSETILDVIDRAHRISLAHCPCRVRLELTTGKRCPHPNDVCMKLDELAEYTINAGVAREITRDQAREVIDRSVAAGLVHFADNTREGIKHICNCCGCACWTVAPIRRREIARDEIIATYFLRRDHDDDCIGCGACEEICPVEAVAVDHGIARTDREWCIGCGLCVPRCPVDAISLEQRTGPVQTDTFAELHERVRRERLGSED